MEKQYKVIALSVGGSRNRIFNSGDIVTDACFHDGHAAKLVTLGFLEEIKEEVKEMTSAEMKAKLKELGVEFPENAKKAELAELLKSVS